MAKAWIVAATRSPIGRAFKGSLITQRPDDLGAAVVKSALSQIPQFDANQLDDVIVGCAQPAGESGYNLARVISVLSGLKDVPGTTVNRYCASSLQGIRMAAHAILAGEGDAFVCGGVETVSRFAQGKSDGMPNTKNPRFDEAQARNAERTEGGKGPWQPPEGLPDIYLAMGQTAENVAELKQVSREEMDEFAYNSQMKAVKAQESGFFEGEITPITLADGTVVTKDDGPRPQTTLEKLSTLKPVFRPDGTISAGNACPLNDGAAAVVVMSSDKAKALGIKPLGRVVASGLCALNPEIMGLGPVEASKQALSRAGLSISDMDIVEINEAFAAQVIPSAKDLGVDFAKLNPFGGAIALGHPFGMTGARIMTTLLHGLREKGGKYGLETMCIGGGQGMAMIVENLTQ